jgi:hypothetical protein
VKTISILTCGMLTVALTAAPSAADKLQLVIGQAFAVLGTQPATSSQAATMKQNAKTAAMAVRAEGCGDPSALKVTATAEGVVAGARRRSPLIVTPVSGQAAFTIARPTEAGTWVAVLGATCQKLTAGAIIPLAGDAFDREHSTFYDRPATPAEVDTAVKAHAARTAPSPGTTR